MCKIRNWVFDSVSVQKAPQNHFEDPNQFNEDENPMFLNEGWRLPARVHNITPLFRLQLDLLSFRQNDMVSF